MRRAMSLRCICPMLRTSVRMTPHGGVQEARFFSCRVRTKGWRVCCSPVAAWIPVRVASEVEGITAHGEVGSAPPSYAWST